MIHRRVTDEYRRVTGGYRRVTDDYRRVTGDYRKVTDESQTTRQVTDNYIRINPKVFLNTFIKHYFQEGYGFLNAPMKS